MSASPLINGMMIVFSITTVAVFLYPIFKLTPSWLDRRLSRQIAFHRAAAVEIGTAMSRAHNDAEQFDRLAAQHAYHRSALQALVPGEAVAEAPLAPRIEAAA